MKKIIQKFPNIFTNIRLYDNIIFEIINWNDSRTVQESIIKCNLNNVDLYVGLHGNIISDKKGGYDSEA